MLKWLCFYKVETLLLLCIFSQHGFSWGGMTITQVCGKSNDSLASLVLSGLCIERFSDTAEPITDLLINTYCLVSEHANGVTCLQSARNNFNPLLRWIPLNLTLFKVKQVLCYPVLCYPVFRKDTWHFCSVKIREIDDRAFPSHPFSFRFNELCSI